MDDWKHDHRPTHIPFTPYDIIWSNSVFERLLCAFSFVLALWVLNPYTNTMGNVFKPLQIYGFSEGTWGVLFLIKAVVHSSLLYRRQRWFRFIMCAVSLVLWCLMFATVWYSNWRVLTFVYALVPIALAVIGGARLLWLPRDA